MGGRLCVQGRGESGTRSSGEVAYTIMKGDWVRPYIVRGGSEVEWWGRKGDIRDHYRWLRPECEGGNSRGRRQRGVVGWSADVD